MRPERAPCTRLRYMPALDGLRALAVAAVLLYHGDVGWARGGYLGVDAFFVLSGFLITGLLLAEWERNGRIMLRAFWARRARRLLPALFLVLGAVALYGATLAPPSSLLNLRGDASWALGYVANWRFILTGRSYFDQFAAPSPLRHVWSLAIEEQFYLVWPLVFVALLRVARGSRRILAAATFSLATGSALLMALLYSPSNPSRAYYGTDTRAQSLLIGAGLALVLAGRPEPRTRAARWSLQGGAFAAAAVVGWWWATLDSQAEWFYRGGFALSALLVALVIAAVTQTRLGTLGALLSVRPIRWLGQVSYGLYLWHWPIFVACTQERVGFGGTRLLVLRLSLTVSMSGASYYLVERPIRRGVLSGRRARVALPAAAGAALAATLAVTAGATLSPVVAAAGGGGPARSGPALPTTRVLVVGDRGAAGIARALRDSGRGERLVVGSAAEAGCSAAPEVTAALLAASPPLCETTGRERWQAAVQRFKPNVVVVFDADETLRGPIARDLVSIDHPEREEFAVGALQSTVIPLSAQGARIVLMRLPPALASAASPGEATTRPAWIDRWNGMLQELGARNPRSVSVVDPGKQPGIGASPDALARWLAPQLPGLAGRVPAGAPNAAHALFLSDSVGFTLARGFGKTTDPGTLIVTNKSVLGCGLLRGEAYIEGAWRHTAAACDGWPQGWSALLQRYQPDVVVGLWGAWELYDWRIDGRVLRFGTPEADDFVMSEFAQAINVLSSTGARIALLTSPYYEPLDAVNRPGKWHSRYDPERVDHWNELIRQVAARHPDVVKIIDLHGYLSPGGHFSDSIDRVSSVRGDGVHFTPAGAELVARWLAPRIVEAAPANAAAPTARVKATVGQSST